MKKYRKPYRIKRKKSIWRRQFFRLGVLLLIFFISFSYLLFFSETFQVKKIIVSGEEKISKEEIKKLVEKKNIFLINLGKTRKNILEKFLQIAEIEIDRSFPDTLNILVIERVAVAVWCESEECFLIDKEGVLFEKASPETDWVEIFGDKELLEEKKISQILEIRSKLKEDLDVAIEKAVLVSPKRLDVKTAENWEIYFNLEEDLNWQVQKLGLVLEKQIPPEKRGSLQYIDLRFSRVYYK